jgi:2-oxoglutarate ferredoxin oxidoreductase subunit beta
MNTFGYHTIHGRATAVASGLKLTRPELTVWIVTGDGDALSIGGNHILHLLRRNINVNILLFNNQVYGLTKGQFSPTSKLGQITKTSPQGVQQNPLNTLQFALGCGASFVARSIDKDPAHLSEVLQAAYQHKGCSFIEIYQDCHVFNSGAFDDFSTKTQRNHHVVYLQAQQTICYGEQGINGLTMHDDNIKKSIIPEEFIIHQPGNFDHAMRLARLNFPEFPVPVGVFYQSEKDSYAFTVNEPANTKKLEQLYRKGAYWSVSS